MKNKSLEILAPAGSFSKMQYALNYGANAVYAGVPDFSLRARINDFTLPTLKKGVTYTHKKKKKFYLTLNIYAHNRHLPLLEKHLYKIKKIPVDGIIISDPGILELVKKYLPQIEIHLSTQANATNWQAVRFWQKQGVKRIILAREVTLQEIKEIHQKVPEVELEYFVHGAMCMSYSGRCILSKWMTGRSANLGDCAQPCRWLYQQKKETIKTMSVEDQTKKFEIDLEEDQHGTYFFNSQDLNLLHYLSALKKAGISSFKIEGRNKSVYYLATVVKAYSKIARLLEKNTTRKNLDLALLQEQTNLNSLIHRGYTTGFLLGNEPGHNFQNSHNTSSYEFVGEVLHNTYRNHLTKIKVHNAIYLNDKIEIISPQNNYPVKIIKIYNEKRESVSSAHGGHKSIYYLELSKPLKKYDLIRKLI